MKALGRKPLILIFALILGMGALWATASLADRPERPVLPLKNQLVGDACDWTEPGTATKTIQIAGLGTFQPTGVQASEMVVLTGKSFVSAQGLKTVPLQVLANGATHFAEGIGEIRFWVDPSRPLTSAIWEKRAGTEFPAIQEMRFHFFFTVEAMPGRVLRSINPARMRSENVRAFPPPPGTVYKLLEPVELEDIAEPGVVVGGILEHTLEIKRPRRSPIAPWKPELDRTH